VLNWLLSSALTLVLALYVRYTFRACKRIYKKFRLPAKMVVAGSFDPDGSIGSSVAPSMSATEQKLHNLSANKRFYYWPYRQYLYVRLFLDEFVGVSTDVYEQRFQTVAQQDGGRWYNTSISNILRNLELPTQLGGGVQTHPVPVAPPIDLARSEATTAARQAQPSASAKATPGRAARRMPGLLGSWRPLKDEGPVGPGSIHGDFELAAFAPLEHHISGAISPADSDSGDGYCDLHNSGRRCVTSGHRQF